MNARHLSRRRLRMQNVIVNLSVEISNLTADAVNALARDLKKDSSQVAGFLLRKGFSNLAQKKTTFVKTLCAKGF